MITDN